MWSVFRRLGRGRSHQTSAVAMFLMASLAVAVVLASQAIVAARQRRAVSAAMVRQYAQLATWEFSRQARRDIDEAVMHTLFKRAHPGREEQAANSSCDCETLAGVEQWFEVSPDGVIASGGGAVSDALRQTLATVARQGSGGMENAVRMLTLMGDTTRFVGLKPEPHVPGGGHVGLIATVEALVPILTRTFERSSLLPALLAGGSDARTLVDLRLSLPGGKTVFASPGTSPGPFVVEGPLLPDSPIALVASASMTPAFIAALGPEHGSGPRVSLVVALVLLNVVLALVALAQLARERELAALRSDFVAGVSHELRTPLAQIRMFSETLLLDRIRNVSERRRALEIIGQESRRLTQLVDNVLHFHRRSRTAKAPDDTVIDLNRFVRDVVDSFAPLAASKRVQLTTDVSDQEVRVAGNADELRQVLLNLLDNAVKFGPAGQTVRVTLMREGGDVMLAVNDQGSGVPAGDRLRIFTAFERGQTARGTGGAGIGLAVVQQIVEAHGGRVVCDGTAEGGARFVVILPLAESRFDEATLAG